MVMRLNTWLKIAPLALIMQREGFPLAAPARSSSWHNNSSAPCWDASPVFSLYVLGGRAVGWGGGTQSRDDAVGQPAGFH